MYKMTDSSHREYIEQKSKIVYLERELSSVKLELKSEKKLISSLSKQLSICEEQRIFYKGESSASKTINNQLINGILNVKSNK